MKKKNSRVFKKAGTTSAILCAGFILSACENLTILSAATLMTTDKTVADHVISFASNKNCSSVREELGMTYCVEDDPQLIEEEKMHCYRELGRVTCYKDPDFTSPRSSIEDKKPSQLKIR